MNKGITIAALVAVIAFCGFVIARNLAPYEDDGYVTARERSIIKKFDRDGDGQLNKLEQREADRAIKEREERARAEKEEWMKRHDTNGDGKISAEEKEAAESTQRKQREAIIKKFDADGDGKLNEQEGAAARKALRDER